MVMLYMDRESKSTCEVCGESVIVVPVAVDEERAEEAVDGTELPKK